MIFKQLNLDPKFHLNRTVLIMNFFNSSHTRLHVSASHFVLHISRKFMEFFCACKHPCLSEYIQYFCCCFLQEDHTIDDLFQRYYNKHVKVTEENDVFVATVQINGKLMKKTRDDRRKAVVALKVEVLNLYQRLGLILKSSKQIVIFLVKSALQISLSLAVWVCPIVFVTFCINACIYVAKILKNKNHLYGFNHFQSDSASPVALLLDRNIFKVKVLAFCLCQYLADGER